MRTLLIVTLTGLLIGSSIAHAEQRAVLGRVIDRSLSLPDTYGQPRSLKEAGDAPAVVIAFLGTECPLARLYGRRLAELAEQYSPKGVVFAGIDANRQDTLTEVSAYASRYNIEFPLLIDADHKAADLFGAKRTPEVFVLDANRVIRYHGRVDDQYGIGIQRTAPERQDLAIALDEVLAGKSVTVPQTPVMGCIIGRKREVEPHGEITYASHVAEILNRRCVECHRDGEIAPFSLTSFEDVAGWEAMIAEVVSEGRMPPWNASPEYGHFKNDARLTDDEKTTLLTWIENGCPLGNPDEIPAPPEFAEGWRIPEPDKVVYMRDDPFDVPATGVVDYQHFIVDPGFTEDMYVTAAEARPGNPEVVHHIIAYLKVPGEKRRGGLGRMLVAYAPGSMPQVFPAGAAAHVPAGSVFIFELHYTPNGFAQSDRSYIGMTFTDKANVTQVMGGGDATNPEFEIPPGDASYVVRSSRKAHQDMTLLSLFPHMHLRGKSFRYDLRYPDGREETLLDVPKYDFNWQLRYELAEPLPVPKGSELICTAVYDNSEENPNNPDPTRTVTWGEQSWDEMMIGFFNYSVPIHSAVVAEEEESESDVPNDE